MVLTRRAVLLTILLALCLLLAGCSGKKKTNDGTGTGAGGSGIPIDWLADAIHLRGQDGTRHAFACSSGGSPTAVWGTDVYTDDSSICTAAVHAGRITAAAGGTVTIEVRPGQASYEASLRNGVQSVAYEAWEGSFVVV